MLAKIMEWFEAPEDSVPAELTCNEAAVALMVEIMMADHNLDKREEAVIVDRLQRRTGDSREEIRALLARAKERHPDNHDLYQFTKVINNSLDVVLKYELIVDLWRTALADGEIDKHEEHMIRRISDLIYLHHSHFIKAKLEAQQASPDAR